MYAVTTGGGDLISSADICKTYVGTAVSPMTYPNTASTALGMPSATQVLISGSPAVHKNTSYIPSNGDEAGTVGGTVSAIIMGEVKISSMSATVNIEGNAAVYYSMATTHNQNNAVGLVSTPSQTTVNINS